MAEEAWRPGGPSPPQNEPAADEPPAGPAPAKSGAGVAVAAVVAALASAGLAWWFAAPAPTMTRNAPPPPAAQVAPEPIPPLRYAPLEPDPAAVKRAWREVRTSYAARGAGALVRGSETCASSLPADPQLLDYCVAFDIYASDIVAAEGGEAAEWFRDAGERDLALARTALPEAADAANRIAQVAALTRAVLPERRTERPKPVRHAAARPAAPKPHAAKSRPAKPVHRRTRKPPRNFPAAIYPYTTLPDPPPDPILDPPH